MMSTLVNVFQQDNYIYKQALRSDYVTEMSIETTCCSSVCPKLYQKTERLSPV